MSQEVTARLRGGRRYTMFADITDAKVLGWSDDRDTGCTTITFDAELDETTVAQVRARMEATDPADETQRAWLAGIDSTGLTNGFDIMRAVWLGQTPPEPSYTDTPASPTLL